MGEQRKPKYQAKHIIAKGTFGVVYAAINKETSEESAIKTVILSPEYKSRELRLYSRLKHPNIVQLKGAFYSFVGDDKALNLVMECVPTTLAKALRTHVEQQTRLPLLFAKLYSFQLLRGLAYIHALNLCHRDIKPQNLLLAQEGEVLKICDFGSTKFITKRSINVSYICSRHYRAPELLFGAIQYSNKVDIWSVGCIVAEMVTRKPLFAGDSTAEQLLEVIRTLGHPTKEQLHDMNPHYESYTFPVVLCTTLKKRMPLNTKGETVNFIRRLLEYSPANRPSALECLCDPFFDDIKKPQTVLPRGKDVPPIMNWTDEELEFYPVELRERIMGF